ncbi:hypothetical protein HY338_00585 [Candidatus Gottesmanbacteria bacterium]|nr:hypothetical protein [Candidatus Gottesmanbacteria bacterium]
MTKEENQELSNSGATPVNEIAAVDEVNVTPEQTAVPVQNEVYSPPPVDNFQQSSVVVSGGGDKKAPVWFYGLFLIVLIIFIIMTFLVYQTMGKSISIPWIKAPVSITATPILPTLTITVTIPPETLDPELTQLKKLNDGDEITDLENDVNSTKLNFLEDDLKDLDNKFNFSSQP